MSYQNNFLLRLKSATQKHFPYVCLALMLYILLGFAVAKVNNWYNPPITSMGDLTIHIPRAFKLNDLSLYERDPVFESFGLEANERLDNYLFVSLLSKVLFTVNDIRPMFILGSTILSSVFVIGIYGLTFSISGDFLAAVIAVILASVQYRALGGVQLGFGPDYVLPRNIVVAISPVLILLFIRWYNQPKLWILYAGLGLLANIHALAALHLTLIMNLTLLITLGVSRLTSKQLFIGGLVCLVFALPVMFSYISHINQAVTTRLEDFPLVISRYAFAIRPSYVEIWLIGISFLPLAVFSLLGFRELFKQQSIRQSLIRVYLTLYFVILGLPWVGVIINVFTFSFTQLEMLRITRYSFMLSFVPIAVLLAYWMERGGRIMRILSPVCLILILFFSRPQIGVIIIQAGSNLLRSNNMTEVSTPKVEPVSEPEWSWENFYALSRWADEHTPVDALFMAPVDVNWSYFWVYGRRALVVTFKGAAWPGWSERFLKVEALYTHPDVAKFAEFVQMYDVDYIIMPLPMSLPGWEIVYENENYRVYKVNE